MGRGGDDTLNLQVLFQGFEERLDLPAFLVNHGNRVGLRPVVRSQKNQGFAGILSKCFDAVPHMRTHLPGSLSLCASRLIFEGGEASLFDICSITLQWGLVLRARDEESMDICSFREQSRVVVVQLSPMTMPVAKPIGEVLTLCTWPSAMRRNGS